MSNRHVFRPLIALVAAVAVALGAPVAASAAAPPPAVMAALGDSISQATDSCGYKNCPAYSWSTGTVASVGSHASRLRAQGATALVAFNDSVAGSKAANLLTQAQQAVAQKADYVTVQIGANDACTSTVAGMTPTATFEAQVAAALGTIAAGRPGAKIFVAGIPNLKTLWAINKAKLGARLVWGAARICPSMLANPSSTSAADNARRDAVQARVAEFNAALVRACGVTPGCTTDGGAVAGYAFTSSLISSLDYFHPNYAGQAKLAEITWPLTPYGS
jgi:lysophospholipase L1-like esterase